MNNELYFDDLTPLAPQGLGGLVRDHFGNGRTFATVCAHGGLVNVSHWGRQHVGAHQFFQGDAQSPWVKLFRAYAGVEGERLYLTLNETSLYPFGYSSRAAAGRVGFAHEMLLLPDALVHRFSILSNPGKLPIRIEALHIEGATSVMRANREWCEWKFVPKLNALVTSCADSQAEIRPQDDGSLAQKGSTLTVKARPRITTWIGIGCDSSLDHHRGYHPRSKHYLAGANLRKGKAAMFLVFANSRKDLEARLAALSRSVHSECEALVGGYEKRLRTRPQIHTGNKVLDSAFSQFPELIRCMKVPDRPGAIKATLAGYSVWGWDGMTSPPACDLANEPEFAGDVLRFYHETCNKAVGIPHAYSSTFEPLLKSPFPAQAQFIAVLYHHVSCTGDVNLARELLPTCQFILDRCRERTVRKTGLVEGHALWPDFPEAMNENGRDVSSMNNSLLYQGLRSMEYLAIALGKKTLAAECREWATRLRASFVRYLFDQKKGFFVSSCDSRTLKPRRHYCPQAVFWVSPFARELVSHDPVRIADFLNKELRSDKCLLTMPHWDSAWMADGNQLGSSFPAADLFYLNVQKLVANPAGLKSWLGDVEWFWRRHTAPEAFTPEAGNEAEIGIDNPGCKQLQACSTWYVGLYSGLAGLDIDHEGITLTPWGDQPVSINGLRLRGFSVNLDIKGEGNKVGSLVLNGKPLPTGSRKISWSQIKGKTARIVLTRSKKAPPCPEIIRADGLSVRIIESAKGKLLARVEGVMSGEIVVRAPASSMIRCDGESLAVPRETSTGTFAIPFLNGKPISLDVSHPM